MIDAEQTLWQHIRRKQIQSVQFYQQKWLLNFISDFYCAMARLVTELDGSLYLEPEHVGKDAERDKSLSQHNFFVLRFDDR